MVYCMMSLIFVGCAAGLLHGMYTVHLNRNNKVPSSSWSDGMWRDITK